MKNNAYWANRMKILEKSLLDNGYDYLLNVEKQYEIAVRDVSEQIGAWYQKFAKNNNITLAEAQRLLNTTELKEFKWTVEEYIKHGRANAVSQAWMKQLKNASARVHITRLESLKLQLLQQVEKLHGLQAAGLAPRLGEIYERGYLYTAFEIQKGIGVGWSLHGLTDSEINKVLARPWTLDRQTFSDRIWQNKQALINSVNTNLTQMIMRGDSPDKAIKTIAGRFNVSKSQAGRLVMTESAAFANAARKDCFNELGVERFVIVETLDGDTCSLCGQLDGKVFPMSEYAVGVTCPPFHPWCRGTTAPYYEDLEGIGERAARDENGEYYTVPKETTFEQWKEKFVKKPFTNPSPSGIITVAPTASAPEPSVPESEPTAPAAAKPEDERLEKFGEILEGNAKLKKDTAFTDEIKTAFANGSEEAQKLLLKYAETDSIDSTTASGCFFSPSTEKVNYNLAGLKKDTRGAATSFLHEFGHLVDFKSRPGKGLYSSCKTSAFGDAIKQDFEDCVKAHMPKKLNSQLVTPRDVAYADISRELRADPELTNQISDLFDGLSKRQCCGKYGHSPAYWKTPHEFEKEAFAHMFETQFDPARHALMEKYFPTALKEFENILKNL